MTHSFFTLVPRQLAGILALGTLPLLSSCESAGTSTKPVDPMSVRLSGMENAALKSRSSYLASVAQQQQEEAAIEAAMPKPDLTQGVDVIPGTSGSH